MRVSSASRIASLLLFVASCALAAYWVTTWLAMRSIPVPQQAQVAQAEAVETGAVRTLFGGGQDGGAKDLRLLGIVVDGPDAGAAILSLDGGAARVVRVGGALASGISLVEVRPRVVVVERNGVRQEIRLPSVSTIVAQRSEQPALTPAPPAAVEASGVGVGDTGGEAAMAAALKATH